MDDAFCARMHAAIAAGLECAPTGVVATPGTKNPKYVSDLAARYRRPFSENGLCSTLLSTLVANGLFWVGHKICRKAMAKHANTRD